MYFKRTIQKSYFYAIQKPCLHIICELKNHIFCISAVVPSVPVQFKIAFQGKGSGSLKLELGIGIKLEFGVYWQRVLYAKV